jgi:tetratricopeptide (TPR) repeat protein
MDPMLNDMVDFITLCRKQYKGNKIQLNILREFQQNYSSDQAIWWVARDTFISQLLNKALRIQNLDLMFLLRFFIRDMERQLKENQFLSSIKVYRYQLMANGELEILRNSIGQFISINNFLLTNANRTSVLPHSKLPLNNNDYQPILFEILADPNLDKIRPFANVTSLNYFPNNQEEVLFMLGSIFQLNKIHRDENDIWIIEMTLSSKTNEHLKATFDNYKNDDNDDTNLLSFGYILQKQNKLDETENYYHRLFDELPDDDERLAFCCLNLGNIACTKTNYDSSLEWLFKSLDISMRTLQANDTFLALIYNSLGHVYNAKNDSKTAIDYYNNAITIWKQTMDVNYLKVAECMNNIGIIYKQEKNDSIALECFKKTLTILEKYLSNDHVDLSKSHCNLASTYRQLGQYDLALEHYNLSYQILEKHYSPDHPNIAKALGNIGIVYALKGERHKALSYYEKTAEIYRQTLPSTHINNIKIDQLIRDVSSTSNRTKSFV